MNAIEIPLNENLSVSRNTTLEEMALFDLVKQRMLQKLNDRRKFIFLYIYELGKTQKDTADALGINETAITRHMKIIRKTLRPFK